jgi:hypothetical protein
VSGGISISQSTCTLPHQNYLFLDEHSTGIVKKRPQSFVNDDTLEESDSAESSSGGSDNGISIGGIIPRVVSKRCFDCKVLTNNKLGFQQAPMYPKSHTHHLYTEYNSLDKRPGRNQLTDRRRIFCPSLETRFDGSTIFQQFLLEQVGTTNP